MGFFDFGEAKSARDELYHHHNDNHNNNNNGNGYSEEHQARFSHELVGGAVAFEAMHLWEKQQRKEGKTVSHGFAKEAIAALAAAEADKLIETKGLGFVDRDRVRHHAKKQAEELYDRQYGDRDQYDPEYEIHESMRY